MSQAVNSPSPRKGVSPVGDADARWMIGRSEPASNTVDAGIVEGGMASNRIDKHEQPKGMVAARLRGMGLNVTEAAGTSSYDLLVNGHIRVTLRVAHPGMRRHRVTVGGRSYRYHYETWHFNFHHHGRFGDRYTDFFVCLAARPKDPQRDRTFVIPWENVSGKTFSLHGGRGEYRGRYALYRDAWGSIAGAAQTEPVRRVA